MATIPDIPISHTEWTNINTLSGIANNVDIEVSNKSTGLLLIQVSAAQPSIDSKDGKFISCIPHTTSSCLVTSETEPKWMLASTNGACVSVQEL